MEEVNQNMDSKEQIIKDDEIDLIEVAKTIWAGRKLILKVTAVFFAVGLIIAFGSKVEYQASCKLMPESQEGMKPNLGGLGSLAGLAGINLDMGGSGALTPELYPQIIQSVPFLMGIWDKPIKVSKLDTCISTYQYLKHHDKPYILDFVKKYTINLPSLIKSCFIEEKNNNGTPKSESTKILQLNSLDKKLLDNLRSRIEVEVDNQTGIIVLYTELPDPYASAELAQLSIDHLTEYLTNYKTNKARINYEFVQNRFLEAKEDFEKTQENLALFSDRNRNIINAYAQTEFQRLQNEYNISFEVYKGLATQLEQSKITLKEDTPAFTVLEPVLVPIKKNSPKRILIIAVFIFIGVLISLGIILGQLLIKGNQLN